MVGTAEPKAWLETRGPDHVAPGNAIPRGGEGGVGMGKIWNGKIWHNNSVPNASTVLYVFHYFSGRLFSTLPIAVHLALQGPFCRPFASWSHCNMSVGSCRSQERRNTNQRPAGNDYHHSRSMLVLVHNLGMLYQSLQWFV